MQQFSLAILIILTLTCCGGKKLDLSDHFDHEAPFQVTISELSEVTGYTAWTNFELKVNSERWQKVADWLQINENGWEMTIASFNPQISIKQERLTLGVLEKGGIILNLKDENEAYRQFFKPTNAGEFDYLLMD